MPKVIIVGSDTPSTYLARGERRGPVELTDDLRKLIRGGYVNIVETIAPKPVEQSVSEPEPDPKPVEQSVSEPEPDPKPVKRARRRLKTVDDVELPTDLDDADESDG